MEDAAAREQQRETRRQKVLARSQARQRTAIVDFASQPQDSDPMDFLVAMDRSDDAPSMTDATTAQNEVKSGARLAAERRRQRILSKRNERMAKVQGDRTLSNEDGGGSPGAGAADGGGSLDKMLEDAEQEVFGQGDRAEAKPSASPPAPSKFSAPAEQQVFKTSPDESVSSPAASREEPKLPGAGSAESKGDVGKAGSISFKPTRSQEAEKQSSGTRVTSSSRRLAGNKALEKRSLDHASVQHLAGDEGAKMAKGRPSRLRRLVGGVQFWLGLEGVTKALLLLLAGAGVGGLLLPQGRAAVDQSNFEISLRGLGGEAQWRMNLESMLMGHGSLQGDLRPERRSPMGFDILRDADGNVDTDEFGAALPGSASPTGETMGEFESREAYRGGDSGEEEYVEGGEVGEGQAGNGDGEQVCGVGAEGCIAEMEGVHDDVVSKAMHGFLGVVDELLRSTHAMISRIWSVGGLAGAACVPAIAMVIIVRSLVALVFVVLRLALGLPPFPAKKDGNAPGMVMNLLRTYVPLVGNILAVGSMIKSILADTSLVIAGTTLTLALCLGMEAGPSAGEVLGGVSSMLGGVGMSRNGERSHAEL